MADPQRPLARHPGIIEEVVEDEVVLLLPHAGSVLVLNAVGRAIWERIDGSRTAETIAAEICAEYEVEPERALADAAAFLHELVTRGLVSAQEP